MDRILAGRAEHSDGALTIVALAIEVSRNALTQRHTDLKAEFCEQVRARGGTPDSERRLRQQVRRLKELRAADAKEITQLKGDVEALVDALHQSVIVNGLLRRQLSAGADVVRLLPHPVPPDLNTGSWPPHRRRLLASTDPRRNLDAS